LDTGAEPRIKNAEWRAKQLDPDSIPPISTINTSDIEELKALTVKEVKALMTMGKKPPNH
jgi:hypothetical protein